MRADKIVSVMEQLPELPYKCILFDGSWGIGKSYAIEQAVKGKPNICNISLFGIKNVNQIYHEALFQLLLDDKQGGKIATSTDNAVDLLSQFSGKIKKISEFVQGIVSEKEWFEILSRKVDKYHIIILDDLERISEKADLKEILGVVEELKKCGCIKVVLVANKEAMEEENQELLNKYCEKVIERVYHITEAPKEINYGELGIDAVFLTSFLEKHSVKNLRTIKKAENLYRDIAFQGTGVGDEDFWDEIKLVCYAIVVEDIERLYYRERSNKEDDSHVFIRVSNKFDVRFRHYISNIRITDGLCNMIKEYYLKNEMIDKKILEIQYKLFLKAGNKSNLYRSEEEINQYLMECQTEIDASEDWRELNQLANEYVYWSNVLEKECADILEDYQERVFDLLWREVKEGKEEELLLYGSGAMESLQLDVKNKFDVVLQKIREKQIEMFIEYLRANTSDKKAYEYSTKLREYSNRVEYEQIIGKQIGKLLLKSSFPINSVTKDKYNTCCNIIIVLHKYMEEEVNAYQEEILKESDKMVRYRVERMPTRTL